VRHLPSGTARQVLALLVLISLGLAFAPAVLAGPPDKPAPTVMTRNQYLGAEIQSLAAAPDPPAFFAALREALIQIAENDFPARARALAREIADKRPDIVGLQEVFDFRINGVNGPPPFVDHLAETLQALEELGTPYVAVASVRNFNATLPADLSGDGVPDAFVTTTDRDVVLVRKALADAGAAVPVPLSAVCARPSADGGPGCNYEIVLVAPTPLGPVTFERGYVAVDVTLKGDTYRFVNTHLEVQFPQPGNPLSRLIQSAQATELKIVLESVTPAGVPLVIVGDINSSPEDVLFPDPLAGPYVPPYQQFTNNVTYAGEPTLGAPWIDTWTMRPGRPAGYTCCQDEDLLNPLSMLDERIDMVFTRETPARVKANVVGDEPEDKTPSGLWPSDHAGVWTRLWF
jgi:endonuclease/exonuclease/phosphatase family metal-dependent hydrolase